MTIRVREPSLLPAIGIGSRALRLTLSLQNNTTFHRVPTTRAHHYIHMSTINRLNASSQWTNIKKISTSYNSAILFYSLSLKKELPCGHLKFSKTIGSLPSCFTTQDGSHACPPEEISLLSESTQHSLLLPGGQTIVSKVIFQVASAISLQSCLLPLQAMLSNSFGLWDDLENNHIVLTFVLVVCFGLPDVLAVLDSLKVGCVLVSCHLTRYSLGLLESSSAEELPRPDRNVCQILPWQLTGVGETSSPWMRLSMGDPALYKTS